MAKMKRVCGAALHGTPMLRPCAGCGGSADYYWAEGGQVRAICDGCGMQTAPMSARRAGEAWNRRITDGARLLSLHELVNSECGYEGDGGGCAAWLETVDGKLRAVIVWAGIDFGDVTMTEIDAGGEQRRHCIEAEGVRWRIWNWKPTEEQRKGTAWKGEPWRPKRALPAALAELAAGDREIAPTREMAGDREIAPTRETAGDREIAPTAGEDAGDREIDPTGEARV